MNRLPSVVGLQMISDETLRILRDHGEGAPHSDLRIALASLLFADGEGVAHLEEGALRRWCSIDGKRMSTVSFVERRIGVLVEAGVLAPGSTPTEMRSMIGRRAVVVDFEDTSETKEIAA